MEAKYIFLLCTAMNYLVIQSVVADTTEKSSDNFNFYETVDEAYNRTIEFHKLPPKSNLDVQQFLWLLNTNDETILSDNCSADEFNNLVTVGINLDEILNIIRKICRNRDRDLFKCMNKINEDLNKKVAKAKGKMAV